VHVLSLHNFFNVFITNFIVNNMTFKENILFVF